MKKVLAKISMIFVAVIFLITSCNINISTAINKIQYVASNQYVVSDVYSYIGRILPRTTVEQFKLNFNISANGIEIYKDDNLTQKVTSGYVASGMKVKFTGIEKVYTISVVGDLNKDGLANQIELQRLIRHIVNDVENNLTELETISLDINNDGEINQIDLTILINYIVFGRLNIGNTSAVKKPKIEIISGQKENSGTYVTDVKLKITPQETTKVGKTTYTIYGSNYTAETEIPADGTITIKGEGVYIVRSYTYRNNWIRSEAAQLVIDKSKTEDINTRTGIMIKLNNKTGEDYVDNTWTNQNIYIETFETTEELEDGTQVNANTQYTLSGPTSVSTPTDKPITIEKEGEYTLTSITTDSIGRTKTNKYNIKIDKTVPEGSKITISEELKESGYYNTQISPQVTHGTDALSGIEKVTWELTGDEKRQAEEVADGGKIQVTEDGETTIVLKTYDKAGNITQTIQKVKIDKTVPENVELSESNVTISGFDITATATDSESGIKKYEFYLDDTLKKSILSNKTTETAQFTDLDSKEYKVTVKVTDNAENTSEKTIYVATCQLENKDIDHIEVEVTNFVVSNDQQSPEDSHVEKIVSNTSQETESKYIQITVKREAANNTCAELEGRVKIIRKDGKSVTDLDFFPQELQMKITYSSNGAGQDWKHQTGTEFLGEVINNGESEIGEAISDIVKTITIKDIAEDKTEKNYFKIKEKKLTGVTSETKLIINEMILGEEKLPFKIIDKTIE